MYTKIDHNLNIVIYCKVPTVITANDAGNYIACLDVSVVLNTENNRMCCQKKRFSR